MAEPYVARHGLGPQTLAVVLFGAVSVAVGVYLEGGGLPEALLLWPLKLILILLFGGGALVLLANALTRRVALRVEPDGISLLSPLTLWPGRRAPDIVAPWSDVAAVVLFHQYFRWPARLRYLGVRLREGIPAPARAPRPGSAGERTLRGLLPHVPVEVSGLSLAVNGWRLNRRRLVAAVRAYAPEVPVAEIDACGRIRDIRPDHP
ncbi:hypothetical protein K7640_22255 [Micromonospora sp. PLK6-60]|uniref:hypothetical protein n=1 Tax=Micromonospora sp. PLK6-60 TaxID=2873383 RepID=UPI001CA69A64|nr:hypothetical protein [Micromonospora sp. PLK6-60]MBY8874554.1 hypothetical protein [Micromonospora sp. PLK6-60]